MELGRRHPRDGAVAGGGARLARPRARASRGVAGGSGRAGLGARWPDVVPRRAGVPAALFPDAPIVVECAVVPSHLPELLSGLADYRAAIGVGYAVGALGGCDRAGHPPRARRRVGRHRARRTRPRRSRPARAPRSRDPAAHQGRVRPGGHPRPGPNASLSSGADRSCGPWPSDLRIAFGGQVGHAAARPASSSVANCFGNANRSRWEPSSGREKNDEPGTAATPTSRDEIPRRGHVVVEPEVRRVGHHVVRALRGRRDEPRLPQHPHHHVAPLGVLPPRLLVVGRRATPSPPRRQAAAGSRPPP